MESFIDNNSWDQLLDYSFIDDITPTDLYWPNHSSGVEIDVSLTGDASQENEFAEKECPRKRGRSGSCSNQGTKACRERLRREKLNESFLELSSILEPGRPAKTDKLAIVGDAIRVLLQLKDESEEMKVTNEKLLEEIKSLKAEKNELREEKLAFKAEKEKIEHQLKSVTLAPAGFMPPHQAAYHAGANKMTVLPGYGFVPMWQYLPPSTRDTSHDHQLRPPAA